MADLEQFIEIPPAIFIARHPLAAYFILADLISWLIELPLVASAQGWLHAPVPFSLHYLTAYGPLLAAFGVTALIEGTVGVRDLWKRMCKWRVGWGWFLFSAFGLVAFYALTALSVGVLTGTWSDWRQLGQVNYLPDLGLGAWLLWILNSGFGEETGWRGFALPRLQKHHSALTASMILTCFWVLWHVPTFFYLTTYVQLGLKMLPLFALGILAGAIVLTWLYNSAQGSILMAALLHGALNFVTATKASEGVIAAIISTIFMIGAVVIVMVFKPANLSRLEKQVIG